MLKITDIARVSKIAQAKGILVGCDNTWTTPLIQRPLELGVDLVFHSSTKFFGGHSDVLGGCIIIKKEKCTGRKNPGIPDRRRLSALSL